MRMKPKEVILTAFECGRTDRIPVTLYGAGIWSIWDFGTTFEALAHDPQRMAEMCVAASGRTRSDAVFVGSGFNNFHAAALGKAFGAGIKYREMGAPDLTAHFVASEDDLAQLDVADLRRDPVVQTLLEATGRVKERIGDTRLVTMTCWGPFTLAARLVGEEEFMKAMVRRPAFVEKTVAFCAAALIHLYEPLVLQAGLECISISDPTASGDLIGRKHMERFAVPGLQKLTGWARGRGVHSILHICGNTGDRLDLFPATGASAIFFDQKVDIARAREALRGRMCFGGNVAPVHVLFNQDAAAVERACREVIEAAGREGGFVLVPGCDIPPTTPYENIRAFHDVALGTRLCRDEGGA